MLRAQGIGIRDIAHQLHRAPSTISRELRRNAATRSGNFEYRATTAQWHAERAARRPKASKLALNDVLRPDAQARCSGPMFRPDVQERLSGQSVALVGAAVSAPQVAWKGRNLGRRKPRRWATAWSPEYPS